MTSSGEQIIALLLDRGGFDGWWWALDEETQNEIVEELTLFVLEYQP